MLSYIQFKEMNTVTKERISIGDFFQAKLGPAFFIMCESKGPVAISETSIIRISIRYG